MGIRIFVLIRNFAVVMASRHLSRSVAMQSLYEWDFKGRKNEMLPEIIEHNIKEFAPGVEETQFIHDLVNGTLSKIKEIDKIEIELKTVDELLNSQ